MPPKSACMCSAGIDPSSSKSQEAHLTPVSAALDPVFNFLATILSPTSSIPPSQQALSGAGTVASMDSLSLTQTVPCPSVDDGDDVIPSSVSFPPLHELLFLVLLFICDCTMLLVEFPL